MGGEKWEIAWLKIKIDLTPIFADTGFHAADNDHPFELWEIPCEQSHWLQRQPKLFSPADCLLWGLFFSKNWDDQTKLICKGGNFWIIKWPSYFIARSYYYKTLGTSFLAFFQKRWELWLSKEKYKLDFVNYTKLRLKVYEDMLTLTCCQNHILTGNIWFVWYETSYSGDERRCHGCGTTNWPNNKVMESGGWFSQFEDLRCQHAIYTQLKGHIPIPPFSTATSMWCSSTPYLPMLMWIWRNWNILRTVTPAFTSQHF